MFKKCQDFLTNRKAFDTIKISSQNESLWKTAVKDKEDQVASIDKWLQTVSAIRSEYQHINLLYTNETSTYFDLSTSKIEHLDIAPSVNEIQIHDTSEFADVFSDESDFFDIMIEPTDEAVKSQAAFSSVRDGNEVSVNLSKVNPFKSNDAVVNNEKEKKVFGSTKSSSVYRGRDEPIDDLPGKPNVSKPPQTGITVKVNTDARKPFHRVENVAGGSKKRRFDSRDRPVANGEGGRFIASSDSRNLSDWCDSDGHNARNVRTSRNRYVNGRYRK